MLLRYTLAFFLIGLLWEVASRAAGEALLPSPVTTALLFFQSLADPIYIGHMIVSLKRLICGLTAGALPALFLGLLLGHLKKADWLGAPLVYTTFPLPKIVLLPVFFLFLGLGDASRVLLIALTTGYQMIVIVRAAALSLDPVYETAITCMSRQLAVLCFQFGDGLSNIMWPTTTLPIACGIAGVSDKSEGRLRHGRCRSLFGRELCYDHGAGLSHHGRLGCGRYAGDV